MCYYILQFSEGQFNNEIYENLYLTNIKETSITVVTFEMIDKSLKKLEYLPLSLLLPL